MARQLVIVLLDEGRVSRGRSHMREAGSVADCHWEVVADLLRLLAEEPLLMPMRTCLDVIVPLLSSLSSSHWDTLAGVGSRICGFLMR